MSVYVYGLRALGSQDIRYVGKAHDPVNRLAGHLSRRAARAVRAWIASLSAPPDVVILETCADDASAALAERVWIRKLWPALLNSHRGGERKGERAPRWTGFGGRARLLRVRMSRTQGEIAEVAGIDHSMLSRIEGGATPNVSAETAVCIARALGTTVEYLVTGERDASWRAA